MAITSYVQEIGAPDHRLAMRDLKPLSGLGREERNAFWPSWIAIAPRRRAEIVRAMVELAEDDIDLDFSEALLWVLEDDDAEVRANATEGLWESESPRVLRRLLVMLRSDPAPSVRASVANLLSRFAYHAELDEFNPEDTQALYDGLIAVLRDQRQPLDVRRRALESAGYFAGSDEVQQHIERAYASEEQLQRESALVAMGRSLLPRWLPIIEQELESRSPALRYEAARAAGEMGEEGESLLPKLGPLVNDSDSEVAFMSIWSLGQIGGSVAKRILEQIRKSGDAARSQAAIEALEELTLGDNLL